MKLWQIPRDSEIWLDGGSTKVIYRHCDGLYSFSEGLGKDEGKYLNLSRFTPLVKVEDHYEIDDESEV